MFIDYMKLEKTQVIAIDLFCGAGGLTRGLLDAGIDVVAGIDIDQYSARSYELNNIRSNGSSAKYIQKDVSKVTKKDILQLVGTKEERRKKNIKFLLAGCAPCQPFSQKNQKRNDKADPRRTLIVYFANLIDKIKPDFIFMENVARLEASEPDTFAYFLNKLEKNNYLWDKKIVNAATYGVPQNRKRFVLMASLQGNIRIPTGAYDGVIKKQKTVRDAIKNLVAIKAGESHCTIENHKAACLSQKNLERIKFKNRVDWPIHLWLECHKKGKKGYEDSYGRMDWDKPSPTLTTKFYSISNGRFGHPEQDRGISLKEGALLQSFPENYIFYGGSQQIIARQIGNAVPPKMAASFGEYLLKLATS